MKTQASLLHPALILALTVLAAATPLAQAAEYYVAYVGPITVDTAPPSLTCPSGVTVASDLGQCYATGVALGSPLASDNSGTVTVTNNAPAQLPVGMTVVIWTAFDPSGNTNNCTQTVTVTDNQPPVLAGVPTNQTFQCLGDVPAPASVTATDNCDGPIPVVLISTTNGTCPTTIVRTWTATDRYTNSASTTQIITVRDTIPPVLANVPGNTNYQCLSDVPPPANVTATDNCDGQIPVALTLTTNGSCPTILTYTWVVSDRCTNSADATRTLTVLDTIPPVFTSCPANVDLGCNPAFIPSCSATAVAVVDNCGPVVITCSSADSTNGCQRLRTITYTATDLCTNRATCVQRLTWIEDTTPPVIHCPSNLTVEFTSETGAVVAYSVAAGDNCGATSVVTCVPPSGSQFPIGATPVNCTATDAASNQISCSFTVTVLGARGAKENVLAELIVLRATVTDPEDGRKLDEAIEHLTKSLAAELWVDQTHLERKHGDKVFQEERETAKKLCELIKSRMSNIPDAVLEGFADRMFRADRLLASVAIQEAVAAGVAKKKIDQARKDLAKGDAETGDDKCANGIGDYQSAWKHAVRPKVSPPIAPTHGRVQLEVLGEPGERFTIQASSNLVDWVTLGICTANAEGVVTFEDADVNRHPVRYYRVVSP